jgi:hypothetical protein
MERGISELGKVRVRGRWRRWRVPGCWRRIRRPGRGRSGSGCWPRSGSTCGASGALAAGTAGAYVARAARFLDGLGGGLDGLTAGDVTAAVLAEAEKVSAGSAQYFVAALRAFLRFCHLEGRTAADLAWAAQAVTGRRRSALARH